MVRKKKSEEVVKVVEAPKKSPKKTKKAVSDDALSAYNEERLVSKFDKKALLPVVTKGSHLTVTKYPDGRVELVWDDEALMRDVQEAIASVELKDKKPAVRAKAAVARKKKTVKNKE